VGVHDGHLEGIKLTVGAAVDTMDGDREGATVMHPTSKIIALRNTKVISDDNFINCCILSPQVV